MADCNHAFPLLVNCTTGFALSGMDDSWCPEAIAASAEKEDAAGCTIADDAESSSQSAAASSVDSTCVRSRTGTGADHGVKPNEADSRDQRA